MDKICPACATQIENKSKQWKKQIYCSDKCRKVAHRKASSTNKRIEQRRANMRQNEEVLFLVRQCRRAKTVQILKGHDSVSFTITMALIKKRPKFDVNLCHIAPVKGNGYTGLLHYKNLFYGGSFQNKKHGNKFIGKGLILKDTERLRKWHISEKMSTNDILIKIQLYLGSVIEEYLQLSSVRKSKKVQISQKICALDETEDFENLIQTSYTALNDKLNKLSNTRTFEIPKSKRESKYINYIDELTRFISYKDNEWRHLMAVRELMIAGYIALSKIAESGTYNKEIPMKYSTLTATHRNVCMREKRQWSEFKDVLYELAFRSLQGEVTPSVDLQRINLRYLKPHISKRSK
jgi:hypothetical protein